MKKGANKKRRCSVCRKEGHNKSKCPVLLTQKKPEKRKIINIRHNQLTYQSPHLINLKKEKKSVWDDVKLFQEKSVAKEKRVTVDLASFVREANKVSSKLVTKPVEQPVRQLVRETTKVPVKKNKIKKPANLIYGVN